MNRRAFLAGLTATAAGLLVPERKVWALDRTMIAQPLFPPFIYESGWFDANLARYDKLMTHIYVDTSQILMRDGDTWVPLPQHPGPIEWGFSRG